MKDRRRTYQIMVLFAILTVVACLSEGLRRLWVDHRARRDFARLLAGDEGITITLLRIEGYGIQPIMVEEPSILGYLSQIIRSAQPRRGELGSEYRMTVRLSTGAEVACVFFVPSAPTREITLFFPLNTLGDPVRYSIALREPVPESLRRLLDRLREWNPRVHGDARSVSTSGTASASP